MKILRQKTLGKIGYLIIFLSSQKTVGGIKDKIVSLFKTNATKNYSKTARLNSVYEDKRI